MYPIYKLFMISVIKNVLLKTGIHSSDWLNSEDLNSQAATGQKMPGIPIAYCVPCVEECNKPLYDFPCLLILTI